MADNRLIITEKPSVARDIGRVLGISRRRGGYLDGGDTRITWCVGHLLELASPTTYNPAWKQWRLETLPMMPERFNLQPRDSARDQFAVVKAQLAGAATVINAAGAWAAPTAARPKQTNGKIARMLAVSRQRVVGCQRDPDRHTWLW